jgi:L-threonylcarbamoyladenylate synthase
MQTVTKDEFFIRETELVDKIKQGELFIYPTDTIYGLGCNAMDTEAITKLRKIKERKDSPFSVIAPSKDWIFDNCIVPEEAKEWIENLPGPFTLVFRLKNKDAVAKNIAPGKDTIGVRIPKHWIRGIVRYMGFPIATTSVNKSGMEHMREIEFLDADIRARVAFAIDEGECKTGPSKIIRFDTEEVKEVER